MRADNIQMFGAIGPAVVALVDAPTISTDASLGNHFRVTLAGNRTLGTPGGTFYDGQILRYEFTQDGVGGRTITMGNNIVKPSNIPTPILTSAVGATDMLQLIYNGSNGKFTITGFLTNIYGV